MTSVNKKLVIVGDGGCGKSCLLEVLKTDQFVPNYIASIVETFNKNFEVDGTQVELEILATNGQEDYDLFRPLSYVNTDVILLCVSIDISDLIENITARWLPELKQFLPNTPIILVCNKKELRNDAGTIEKLRRVRKEALTEEDGRALAKRINACAYLECSAATKEGVKEVFQTAARIVLQAKKKKSACVLS